MYRTTKEPGTLKAHGECPECKSKNLLFSKGKIFCTNCEHLLGSTAKTNKYGAKRTEYNGKMYDSGFEAQTAHTLELRKRAKDIKDYDIQYQVEMWTYREHTLPNGQKEYRKAVQIKHKIDFRIHHHDGSFELYEAKGIETDDYKWRRKFVENVFLPLNPDHIYTVVKQNGNSKRRKR